MECGLIVRPWRYVSLGPTRDGAVQLYGDDINCALTETRHPTRQTNSLNVGTYFDLIRLNFL